MIFTDATEATISRDGSTLIVSYEDRLEVWDLPPRGPWGKVLAVAGGGTEGEGEGEASAWGGRWAGRGHKLCWGTVGLLSSSCQLVHAD